MFLLVLVFSSLLFFIFDVIFLVQVKVHCLCKREGELDHLNLPRVLDLIKVNIEHWTKSLIKEHMDIKIIVNGIKIRLVYIKVKYKIKNCITWYKKVQ